MQVPVTQVGGRVCGARILPQAEPFPNPIDDVLWSVGDVYLYRRLWHLEICQLAGENCLAREMPMTRSQTPGNELSASVQINEPYLWTDLKLRAITPFQR